ncbi:Short-chain dehydrogenase/reductase ucsE [Psilocybe cubensis]|uniref:Uncharacterized protein n=2 Tax=Psilocybe cubensis TaxID=181762 RepID=A0A8H7XNE7_PSICU|nr:Short-chain dehydrogenase/reductase ucsE [Psilocybe cubensis]KAH9476227.1 Short-chain dehydrogenase/reductase ucsE [Psilocybe cubensis]
MTTLANKTVVVVGGSSGIGFAVALGALQSQASVVIIASSAQSRVDDALARLRSYNLPGEVRGEVLDAKDSNAVKEFAISLGTVDHIVWTSADVPKAEQGTGTFPFSNADTVEQGQGSFTVKFWGPFILSKHAKFHPGGSLTLTSGLAGFKPFPGGSLGSGVSTALEGLTRGLAVDLAPVRVNLISPGLLVEKIFGQHKDQAVSTLSEKTVLKRGGSPSECAEAYLFVMKCGYITGQNICVEGGYLLT